MSYTDYERDMLELVADFSANGIPLVFKGGLVTKTYLLSNGQEQVTRNTVDIDANLAGNTDFFELCEMIGQVIGKRIPDAEIRVKRIPAANMTGRVEIVKDNNPLYSLDIDPIHPTMHLAEITIGDTKIPCVEPEQIIADKISAISAPVVFRRSKDLIDLYGLSRCTSFSTQEIRQIVEDSGHRLGDFGKLIGERANVEHAYERLRGVVEKPPFSEVYDQILRIIEPFVREPDRDLLWDPVECDYSLELDRDDYDDPEEDLER